MKIVIAILIFSLIIVFHELGHFFFARLTGVEVIEFSLGMGPRLLSRVSRRSKTRFSWKLLPFGGSCMMKGEDSEDDTQGAFGTKKVWQRLLIVAGGPLFNFILAFILALIILMTAGADLPVVAGVTGGYAADRAGIEPGDTITSIGGTAVTVYRDISNFIIFRQKQLMTGKKVRVSWEHEGEQKSALLKPQINESGTRYIIGISGGGRFSLGGNPLKAVKYGLYEVKYWISTTLSSLGMIFQGQVSISEVSGPVGVVKVIGDTYEQTRSEGALLLFLNMLNLSVLLTANLGVMNLLPFPALDGGRIVLLLLEAVRRKKIDPRIEGMINLAGFACLMLLMAAVLMNDTRKLF